MKLTINKQIIAGHLGKDCSYYSAEKFDCITFSVATTFSYKNNKNEWVSETEWHSVKYFGKSLQKLSEKLKKGTYVYVEGRGKSDSYENKEGEKVFVYYLKADYINIEYENKNSVDLPKENDNMPF
jgi:single-strand DNA-binding protein